ncbi:MAG: hypothetical protein QOC92_1250 [Acidimicrobiaceae bacterium]
MLITVAVVVPLVALGVVITRGGGSAHKPARLPIAAGSGQRAALGVAPVDAAPALYPYGGIVYKAGTNLPALDGQARAYKVGSVDEAAVRRLADAFGLKDHGPNADFTFINGEEQLTVEPTGGSWGYSRSSAGGGSVSSGVAVACQPDADCPAPSTTTPQHPADLPSKEGAKAVALGLLQRAGIDTDQAAVTVDDAITQWIVRVDPTVDGVPTEGFGSTITVGEGAVIEYASGILGAPVAADEYPLMGSGTAIERLNKGEGHIGPQPMWAQDAKVADAPAGASTITGAGSAPGSAGPTEPAPLPACDGVGAPTTFPCGSAPDAPVTNTLPPPSPQEITLTGVEQVLLLAVSYDGSERWLVPGYRFSTADGVGPSVLAIDDSFLTPPDQVTGDKGAGSSAGSTGSDGAATIEPAPVPPQPAPASDGGR